MSSIRSINFDFAVAVDDDNNDDGDDDDDCVLFETAAASSNLFLAMLNVDAWPMCRRPEGEGAIRPT